MKSLRIQMNCDCVKHTFSFLALAARGRQCCGKDFLFIFILVFIFIVVLILARMNIESVYQWQVVFYFWGVFLSLWLCWFWILVPPTKKSIFLFANFQNFPRKKRVLFAVKGPMPWIAYLNFLPYRILRANAEWMNAFYLYFLSFICFDRIRKGKVWSWAINSVQSVRKLLKETT